MLNNVSLVGRVTRDPEMRTTNGGKTLAVFTLAVQRTKDEADFIPCEAWEKTAESLRDYVTKGSMIGVEGSIRVENYEVDGAKKTFTKVRADRVHFILLTPKEDSAPRTDAEIAGRY